jgi:hypothetical protein
MMMKRIVYLAVTALVAMMLLVPTAFAQQMEMTRKVEATAPLPPSGGPGVGTLVLPAAALLIGSGVLAYAVLRRRQ